MFDALGYIKKLEELGVSREVAELQVKMHMDIYNSEIVTPKDMNLLSSQFHQEIEKLKAAFADFKAEMKIDMAEFKEEIRNDIALLKNEIEIRFFNIENRFIAIEKRIGALENKIDSLENRIVIKVGFMMTAAMGIFALLLK
ncbi:MAG: DUF1640 domain-containing protein [Bacteriovoracaceae bacterium]|nr:DUF1640 domain-containing protein [Bacteriovoracaceae bacterium]